MDLATLTYLLAAALVLGLLGWRLAGNGPDTYGSGRWLKLWEASREGMLRRRGLLTGDWEGAGLLPVYAGHDGHNLLIAPTGRGKGIYAILPNLLKQNFMIVVDPGGENTAVAIKSWRQRGLDIQVLSPWGMHREEPWALPQHSFNPLAILDPRSERFASDASLIAEMLVTRGRNDSGNTSYFKDEAQSGIRAMLMHMAATQAPSDINLVTLRRWIVSAGPEWTRLIEAMMRSKVAGGMVAGEAAQLLRRQEQAPEEFSAIVSTMKQDTNFLDDPVMRRALATAEADFSVLKGTHNGKPIAGAAIAIVIPLEYLRTHAAYARLAIAVALWEMQRAPIARERVLFVLDEFPALGRMDRIAQGLAELRKYRVWLWPVVQDLSQLKALYKESWATFLSNAAVKQWFGTADLETARYISESCGDATVNAGQQGRSLLARRRLVTTEEVQHMPLRRQIVMAGNLMPMRQRLTAYWERPEFQGAFNQNPYAPATPALPPLTGIKLLWGALAKFAAALVEPKPMALALVVFGLAYAIDPGWLEGEHYDRKENHWVCNYRGVRGAHQAVIKHWNAFAGPPKCPSFKTGRTYW